MSSLTDYLSTLFITDDQIQTSRDVAAAQQAILDRQLAEGKRSWGSYIELSAADDGTDLERYKDENDDFITVIPWWVWLALLGVVFWYLGGFYWLRNILAKK